MKNQVTKLKLKALLVCLITSMMGFSQSTYLKITKHKSENDYVMYPPGTRFELINAHGYVVFRNSDEPGIINIDEEHTLYVYPSWKDSADIIKLTEGSVEKILKEDNSFPNHENVPIESNGVTANYSVTDSDTLEGKKNLMFKLSNGITFNYEDGKYMAYLNNKENYLHIENKYLIKSEYGTLKLSFNSNNGETWWVFESIKN